MKITDITMQKRIKGKYNIFIDGEYSFSLFEDTLVEYALSKGKYIDDETIEEMRIFDEYSAAKHYTFTYLLKSLKTEKEVIKKLRGREYHEATIEKLIGFLKEHRFVDVEYYVGSYIESKINKDSIRKIRYDLMNKGIGEYLIESKLDSYDNEDYEIKSAMLLIKKKLRNVKELDKDQKVKIYKYIVGKGYSYDIAKRAMERVVDFEDEFL